MLSGLPGHVSDPDPLLYLGDNYLVLDFETTNLWKGSPLNPENRMVLAVWKYHGEVKVRFGNEYELAELIQDVEKADFIVAHNAKFECGWLRRCGQDLRRLVAYCTMIGEYVRGGNRFTMRMLSLDKCLKRYNLPTKENTVGLMLKLGIPTEYIPRSWLERYCIRDVEAAEELFLKQREVLKEKNLLAVQYQRCMVTPCLADIEFNGLQLDEEKVNELVQTTEEAYAKAVSEHMDFTGGVQPSETIRKREFIFEQLGFEPARDYKGRPILTGGGMPSVKADAMDRLKPRTERQREYLSLHKKWSALHSDVTKYLRKFADCCKEAGGSIIGVFNQCNTKTHRFSSTGLGYAIQLQNLNRAFKPLFRARNTGWSVGEMDGAQLEFRIAAHLGRDGVALRDIRDGRDVHSFSASILGVSRQDAKRHTFKPLYGGSSGTEREREYYTAFAERYSGIAETQRRWVNTVLNTKKLVTEWGLVYYWPDTRLTNSGYVTNTTSICNYPVQAFATAEIIPISLVCAWHRLKDTDLLLVNTVHDSIVGEIPPGQEEVWHEAARQCLIEDPYHILKKLYGISLTVPLGAGVKIGEHWGVGEEIKYQADDALYIDAAKEAGML